MKRESQEVVSGRAREKDVYAARIKNWRFAAALALFGQVLSLAILAVVVVRGNEQGTVYFALDALGRVSLLESIDRRDDRVVSAVLSLFVEYAFSISRDEETQKDWMLKAQALSLGQARSRLKDLFKEEDPFLFEGTIEIDYFEVEAIPSGGKNTWQIVWRETHRKPGSGFRQEKSFDVYATASVSFEGDAQTDREEEGSVWNKFGVYVSALHIGRKVEVSKDNSRGVP
ncbi:MAG: type IV secretion system protein [Acidobacteriota bacterium]